MTDKVSKFEVTDKKSFVEFLNLFREDFAENPQTWENDNLNSFLEALIAYTEDIDGYYKNLEIEIDTDKANWRMFADMLRGAKVYE